MFIFKISIPLAHPAKDGLSGPQKSKNRGCLIFETFDVSIIDTADRQRYFRDRLSALLTI